MTLDEVNDAHFARLRQIDRLYDTGKIDQDELRRLERFEERVYDSEIERVSPRRLAR